MKMSDNEDDEEYEPYCPEVFPNICSFNTSTWKSAESYPYVHRYIPGERVFVEGGIHWFAYRTADMSLLLWLLIWPKRSAVKSHAQPQISATVLWFII